MEAADSTRRTLEERIRNLELENRQYDPRFFTSLEVGQGDRHANGLGVPMMFDLYF